MPFNPNDHLIKLQGKDYLEVKWRLVWLREQHPDAAIVTEILNHNPAEDWCVVRATVTIPGGGSATGMVLQRPTGVAKDYIANGETSAIGRALGALGYGTQFAGEFDQGDQVVDSPVAMHGARITVTTSGPPVPSDAATPLQRTWYLDAMAKLGHDQAQAEDVAEDMGRAPFRQVPAAALRAIVTAVQAGTLAYGPDAATGHIAWRIVEPTPSSNGLAVAVTSSSSSGG